MIRRFLALPSVVRLAVGSLVAAGLIPLGVLAWTALSAARLPRDDQDFTLGGLERAANELLRGAPGSATLAMDTLQVGGSAAPPIRNSAVRPTLLLRIDADTSRYPAFQRHGYLNDEVRRFNAYQRWVARVALDREAQDSLEELNPSVWRIVRAGSSAGDLQAAATTDGLRRPPPFEEAFPVTIVGSGSRETIALLGARLALPLDTVGDIKIPDDPVGRSCQLRRPRKAVEAVNTLLVYCLSPLVATERLNPQLRLSVRGNAVVLVAGYGRVRVDGREVLPGDSVVMKLGTLIELPPVGSLLLTRMRTDVIATSQWISGRFSRFDRSQQVMPFPLRLYMLTAVDDADDPRSRTVAISIDASLSESLMSRLRQRVRERALPIDFVSVVLADASRGSVLAMAELRAPGQSGRVRGFESGPPGSIVKPLLAASVLSRRPDLASLTTVASTEDVRQIVGLPVRFATAANCPIDVSARVDLERFIRCSDNRFAATLLLSSLFPPKGAARSAIVRGAFPRDALVQSPVASGLFGIFDRAADEEVSAATPADKAPWAMLRTTGRQEVRVSRALWPRRSSPTLVERGTSGTTPGLLAMYSIGGWLDRWSPFDLTEAFARLATDSRVTLRFSKGDLGAAGPEALGLRARAWYRPLMRGLRRVGEDGTAAGLARLVKDSLGAKYSLWSKTGTLGEDADRLFVRSLGFVIGEEGTRGQARCGVAGVVFFRFRERPGGAAKIPAEHVAWFREDLVPELRRSGALARACARGG